MAMNRISTRSINTGLAHAGTRWWARLTNAPLVLQAYIVFCVSGPVFGLIVSFVAPAGGLVFAATGFLFTLFFAVLAALGTQRKLVYIVIGQLALSALLEIVNSPVLADPEYLGPFAVAMTVFWMLLLLSPSMRRWMHAEAADAEYRAYQVSLADLMYLMLSVCVALGSALMLAE